jgi:hypothetical protein
MASLLESYQVFTITFISDDSQGAPFVLISIRSDDFAVVERNIELILVRRVLKGS